MSSEQHSNNSSIVKVALNLTITCLISGLIIAVTYFITGPVAAQKAVEMTYESMQSLVKDADDFKPVEGKENWYAAEKNGKVIAYVVPSETKGYGGKIKMLVAVSSDGKVIDYVIESANETPGLGDRAAKDPFKSQFAGKTAEQLVVTKDPSNKENIQAMTGATISSKAVTKGVREAVEAVVQYEEGK